MSLKSESIEVRSLAIGDEEIPVRHVQRSGGWSYRMKLGRETIWLNQVEYRILSFLAETPYRPYTREKIAAAVTTDRQPIAADSLDEHIDSLREKLGFFRDYIQSVPYIGYRFKA